VPVVLSYDMLSYKGLDIPCVRIEGEGLDAERLLHLWLMVRRARVEQEKPVVLPEMDRWNVGPERDPYAGACVLVHVEMARLGVPPAVGETPWLTLRGERGG
jgi:hypothetical protein